MEKQIVFLIIYLLEALISYIYANDIFDNKLKPIKSLTLAFAIFCVTYSISIVFNNNIFVNALLFVIANFVYLLVSFDVSVKSALFNSSILTAIMSICEIFVEVIINSIIDLPLNAYSNRLNLIIVISVTSKLLYLLVCKIISALKIKKYNKKEDIKRYFPLFLYPFNITVLLIIYFYISIVYNLPKHLNLCCSIISILSLFFCCFIFIYNQKIQSQQTELIELQSEAQKNEINKTFYELLERKNEDQRVLVHDIKHHFSAISMMNDVDEIKNYLANIQPQFEEYKYIGKSKNKMLDLIISKYSYICEKSNIDFNADVRSSNLSFIEDSDLTSLLSNLLDNAVEAAKGAPNASIRFITKKENNFFILSVVNTSSHAPKSSGEKLITTKQDNAIHGYGSKSIERTAKKYNGICSWDYNESDRSFHYNIIFNS